METKQTRTMDVVTAGKILGIGRTCSYRLVHAGVIPALRLGKQLRVPVAALQQMLRNPRPLDQNSVREPVGGAHKR